MCVCVCYVCALCYNNHKPRHVSSTTFVFLHSINTWCMYVCMYVCIILEPAVGAEERNRVEGSGCPGQVVVGRLLRDDSLPLRVLSGAIEIEISIVLIM